MHDRVAALVDLATRHPAHLAAFVRCNDRIFLNPDAVGGDITAPLTRQLEQFLSRNTIEPTHLDDIECALRTGVVGGGANGDLMEDEGDFLDEQWRASPIEAWATILTESAAASKGCVVTPGGLCVGPLAIERWLEANLPPTLALLRSALRCQRLHLHT